MKRLYATSVFWPTWGWNLLLGRVLKVRPWWSIVDNDVILGARPLRSDVNALHEMGVRGIVNTCEEFDGHHDLYLERTISQLHVPTTDFQPPSLSQVTEAVEFMERFVSRGEKVYVHCKAGRARSATVVICWLLKNRGLSIEEAQARLLECRPHVNPRVGQRQVVKDFFKLHVPRPALPE